MLSDLVNKMLSSCKLLLAAVLLLASGYSHGIVLNPDGTGQVLLFPYYTAREGNDTLITLVNTTDEVKAVRVRFMERMNSREVLTFNLYLGPWDTWVAAVTSPHDGEGARLLTWDGSCMVPLFSEFTDGSGLKEIPFSADFFTGAFDDGATGGIGRLLSGYFEVIEMGVVVDDEQNSASAASPPIRDRDCEQLAEAWSPEDSANDYWLDDPTTDLLPPAGGLRGSVSIINVRDGVLFSYDAEAIDGFSTAPMHFAPSDSEPHLNSGTARTSVVAIDGVMDEQTWRTGVEAVSAVLMQATVHNEFVIEGGLSAQSEWIITLPTHRFYTDPLFAVDDVPLQPFTRGPTVQCYSFSNLDEENIEIRTREGVGFQPGVTTGIPPPRRFFGYCGVNVIRISDSPGRPLNSPISGEPLEEIGYSRFRVPGSQSEFTSGFLEFDVSTPESSLSSRSTLDADGTDTGTVYEGLPMIGFMVTTYTNGALFSGNLANYGGTFRNGGKRRIGTVP